MKTLIFSILIFFSCLICFGQELEFSGSMSTSTEQRFQGSDGIGFQYQHDVTHNWKIGLGIHYNFKKTDFDYLPYVDADPDLIIADRINAHSNRFSFRLNFQGLIKNNENVSISLGPEVSYNYLWGKDQIDERIGDGSNRYNFSRNTGLEKELGIGLISMVEVRNFMSPLLSVCFTFRPELLAGRDLSVIGADPPVFSGFIAFSEFQLGLKYSLRK